jgi:tetratricopeptide (TPR) repeat protein
MLKHARTILISVAGLLVISGLVYQIPAVQSRLVWRFEVWSTYFQNMVVPVGKMPTPLPSTPFATFTPESPTPTSLATLSPTPTLLPLPPQASLPTPKYELQGINNCGPATLAMALRLYGWSGDQYDIAKIIKPLPQDRNVNPDELRYFVLNEAGWLSAEYRVAGDLNLIKRLLAANYPVIIEEQSKLAPQDANGPNDDLWDAHYLLLTGYDDQSGVVVAQDSYHGPDLKIPYDKLMADWKPFNYLYMGENWNPDQNRQNAMTIAQAAVSVNPNDYFAWFNLGSSLVYFERYKEAVAAFDKSFTIGLPQRMTRYQFFPFFAYYNADRIDYLLTLTENTYAPIPGNYSEEALLWHGYGLLRKGDNAGALADWNKALKVHPDFCDAEKAVNNYIQPTYQLTNCSP